MMLRTALATLVASVLGTAALDAHAATTTTACSASADDLRTGCASDVVDNLSIALAACHNVSDTDARLECRAEANAEASDARAECTAVFNARKAVCAKLGEGRYEPAFGEEFVDHFVDPRDIGNTIKPNPFFPVIAGATREFRGVGKERRGRDGA